MRHLARTPTRTRSSDLAAAKGIVFGLLLGAGAQLTVLWLIYTVWQLVWD